MTGKTTVTDVPFAHSSVCGVSQQVKLPATGGWNAWKDATTTVTLPQGDNDITVTYKTTDTGWINLDHLVLTK